MRGINKVTILGVTGADPEIRNMPNGNSVANLSVATSEQWKDKATGQRQEKTEWHRIVFFGRLAEVVEKYVKKGNQIYIEGRLQTRKWTDKQGNDRYTTEIVAAEMQMLGGRSQQNQRQNTPTTNQPQSNSSSVGDNGYFDDEPPF